MRLFLAIIFLVLGLYSAIGQTANSNTPKNSIALLGTYHFNNPNQDQFNVNSDNVLSDKRQKEIEALVAQLAKYKPTHIALEFNANDTAMDANYQRYLKGQYTLNSSERDQIGFRLAKLLKHPHVYPVDAPDIKLDFDPGPLAADHAPLLEELNKYGSQILEEMNGWVKKYSIGQVLAKLNAPELNRMNINLYYQYLLPIGKDNNQPGAEAVARWYKRNLLILHHIMKLTEGKSGQRVLVVFGQGHTALLDQFLQNSSIYTKENISKYLPLSK